MHTDQMIQSHGPSLALPKWSDQEVGVVNISNSSIAKGKMAATK